MFMENSPWLMKLKIFLMLFCSCFLLAACQKEDGRNQEAGDGKEGTAEEAYYQADYTDVDFNAVSMSAACLKDEDVYILATAPSGKERMLICGQDGSISQNKRLKGVKEGEELLRLFEDEDGSLRLLTQAGSRQYLYTLDGGTAADKIKLKTGQELYMDGSTSVVFYDGKIWFAAGGKAVSFNGQGKQEQTCQIPGCEIQGLFCAEDSLYAYALNYSGQGVLCGFARFDPQTGSFGEVADTGYGFDGMDVFSGEGGRMYIKDNTGVCSYHASDGSVESEFNFLSLGMAGSSVYECRSLGSGDFFAVCSEADSRTGGERIFFAVIQKGAPKAEEDRLVLAGIHLSDNLKKEILSFNRENGKARIEVVDYSSYSNPQDRMNLDLASGDVPDILSITNADTMGILLKNKVLTDLYPLMEKDEEVKKEAFLPAVLKAMETDGKLYAIGNSFGMQLDFAGKDITGSDGGWTGEEMIRAFESMGEGAAFMPYDMSSYGGFLENFLFRDLSGYIDRNSGKASFLSEDFIRLLEFSSNFSKKGGQGDDGIGMDVSEAEQKAQKGSLFLYRVDSSYGITHIPSVRKLYEKLGGAAVMSQPSKDRNRHLEMAIDPLFDIALSITEQCRDKEAAWEFVRSFLTYDEQIAVCFYGNNRFPVRQDALDKCLEYFMAEEDYKDGERYIWTQEDPFDEEDTEMVKDIVSRISSCSIMGAADEKLCDIIKEEADAFYSGDKTAQEAAKLIQNRAELYLNESK